jgi:hypothetical protein
MMREGGHFKKALMDAAVEGFDNYKNMAEQMLASDTVKREFAKIVLDVVYGGLKAKGGVTTRPAA